MSDEAVTDLAESNDPADGDGPPDDATAQRQPSLATSEASLTLSEARSLSGRRGAILVLPIGEVGTGKTTLTVEMWTAFLMQGKIGAHRIAGSRSAIALEERAYFSRIESQYDPSQEEFKATTLRTQEADDGFLHMRIQRPDSELVEVLIADFTGEHFERIREGTELLDELPWAGRADRFLLILDAQRYATPGEREIVLNRLHRQIYRLVCSNIVDTKGCVAIVVTKTDVLSNEHRESLESDFDDLAAKLRSVDEKVALIFVAARPADESPPKGLEILVEWICAHRAPPEIPEVTSPAPSREISRFVA